MLIFSLNQITKVEIDPQAFAHAECEGDVT
jgi:hypothetical protein